VGFSNSKGDLGWLQVKVTLDGGFPTQLELISWAYNDAVGGAINAGQTTGGSATPEPGTEGLALLALGATGILALRKRRKELAVSNADLKL
jgi:MYXO-CTERM domain-containing protein